MNSTRTTWIVIILISLFVGSCSRQSLEKPFVRVKNIHFYTGDELYNPIGVNMWYAAYLGADTVVGGRDRLCKELDLLEKEGVNNIRILGASEQSELKMGLPWGMQTSPGVYDEKLMEGLDFFLSELGKRKMYAVIFLNNYWQWSGGMAQYMAWKGFPLIDPDATGDWSGFMNRSASFYENDSANLLYREYIRFLIGRKNTINGVLYKNDPSIMAWQLANEPRPGTNGEEGLKNRKSFVEWIDNTAGFIKSLDTNHLVSTGNEGLAGSIMDSSIFLDAHRSSFVDYLTFHLWPKNWGWYRVNYPNETMSYTVLKSKDYLDWHNRVAVLLNKPLVLEEFGMERDSGKTLPGTSTVYRDKFYSKIFNWILESVDQGQPLSGFNIWAWGGMGIPARGTMNLLEGADYLGDPLQEPQGLNSVFSSDSSTLSLIRQFSDAIQSHYKGKKPES